MTEQRIDENKLTEGLCDTPETCKPEKGGISEDWLAVWIGLTIFVLSLGVFVGWDILGWGVTTGIWTSLAKALNPVSTAYKALGGPGALIVTYIVLTAIMTVGATALKANIKKFIIGFTVVFWISYICWIIGSWAPIAVTTAPDLKKFGISWSLKLTPEAGFIVALLVGLILGNFFPSFAAAIKEAVRPEWYIKTAIVILGGFLGVTAAEKLGLASAVMFRGLCAIVEAYLIYWALVYFIARKYFKFSREWAAPLASGISICGVSAAIATGGAIKARPVVPIMVSSLVVIFAVVELLILPFFAEHFLYREPMVAGAWMGLAVKTDGAAVASGAVAEGLIRAKALAVEGVNYKEGWIMGAAATVKVFIDIFIGIWAFVLAIIWCSVIECKPGEKFRPGQIWERFPKFVIGYVVTFAIILWICVPASKSLTAIGDQVASLTKQVTAQEAQLASLQDEAAGASLKDKIAMDRAQLGSLNHQLDGAKNIMARAKSATNQGNVFRGIFFTLTFFTIGLVSNFRKLWEEGIGKLAAVYVISLFGFIIWIGLFISWIFFHGVKPPLAG
ncbi:MAG: putative sulfate exporter family transporter [Syntrophobacteraceae bacterium]|jgi:uncharacterized membrane protein YadS